LTRTCGDRTRGDGFKLKEGRFRLDIRKKFFTMRVVRPWPSLPREAVGAPSLAVLKARLDGALSNLVWWQGSLPTAWGLERRSLRSLPTQTILWFSDSMIINSQLAVSSWKGMLSNSSHFDISVAAPIKGGFPYSCS